MLIDFRPDFEREEFDPQIVSFKSQCVVWLAFLVVKLLDHLTGV